MQTNIMDYPDVVDTSIMTFDNIREDIVPCMRDTIYHYICEHGSVTCKELARLWGMSSNDISGRFTELLSQGRICVIGTKNIGRGVCRIYGVI